MKILRFIPAMLFLLLCGFLLIGLLKSPNMQNMMASTDRALPDFNLQMLGSKSDVFTPATLKNQVSLVHFFATWCGICMREQPNMIKLSKDLNIPIYAVMWRSPEQAVLSWKNNTDAYEHVALDDSGQTGMAFGIMGVPHTFLVDKNARIQYGYVGNISEEELTKRLIPLIRKYQNEL